MKMIKRLALITLLFQMFLYSCNSTVSDLKVNTTNDSIKRYLDLAGNDTLDFNLRIHYNDKAYSFIDFSKNDTLTRYNINLILLNYLKTNRWCTYKNLYKVYLKKSLAKKDTLGLARCYRYKAGYYKKIHVLDSSLYYYIKAEKYYKKTKDKIGLALVYSYKSLIQYSLDDYIGSELSAEISNLYFLNNSDNAILYKNLVTIGNCEHNLRNYNSAIISFKKALFLAKKYKIKSLTNNNIGTCINNIGNSYREQKKYRTAIYYFKKALKEKKLIKTDPGLYAFLLNNLVFCKLELRDYSEIPDMLNKSICLLQNDYEIKESTISYIYLSKFYLIKKDTVKAIQFSENALDIAKKANAPYYYLTALSYAGSINNKKASQYIEEYHKKNDSLTFTERKARNQYFKIQLETDEITHEKEKAIQQKWIITGVSACIIVIIILILIITYLRSKQKELALLQDQQNANQELNHLLLQQKSKAEEIRQNEKKRIALELHDGIMNKLSSTRLNLSILSHKKDPDTIQKCLQYINDIYQIEQDIRVVSHDLNHKAFHQNDSFLKILEDFIVEQNKTSSTLFSLEMDPEINWEAINSMIKINLYRIIQEGSQNIKKYAEAQNATITFALDGPNICMAIADDGIGFDVTQSNTGIGLTNMATRVKSLNGKMNISSLAFQNTSISFAIPLENTI